MASSLFDLSGRIALVTGSSGGLGFAMARGLAEAGATTVLNGRNLAKLEAAREALQAEGADPHIAAFDVTDPAAVEEAVARIEGDVGPIAILVNNAGIQRRAPILEMPDAVWEEVIRNNLTSVFLVGRAVARRMVERRAGKIINIASLASEVGRKTIAPYTASKGGVRQLTRAMCVEWAPFNIQVNAIGPGYFLTELNTDLAADAAFDRWVKARTPAGRWAEPQELVGTAVYLASPASDFVNGQIVYVDGGLLASM
jgi:gluconate 5-dehydrogenase